MPLKRANRARNPLKNIAGGATRAPNVVGKLSSSHFAIRKSQPNRGELVFVEGS